MKILLTRNGGIGADAVYAYHPKCTWRQLWHLRKLRRLALIVPGGSVAAITITEVENDKGTHAH